MEETFLRRLCPDLSPWFQRKMSTMSDHIHFFSWWFLFFLVRLKYLPGSSDEPWLRLWWTRLRLSSSLRTADTVHRTLCRRGPFPIDSPKDKLLWRCLIKSSGRTVTLHESAVRSQDARKLFLRLFHRPFLRLAVARLFFWNIPRRPPKAPGGSFLSLLRNMLCFFPEDSHGWRQDFRNTWVIHVNNVNNIYF